MLFARNGAGAGIVLRDAIAVGRARLSADAWGPGPVGGAVGRSGSH